MHPSHKLINQIKRAAGGRVGEEGLERSLAMLEAETPVGALMSTLAAREFRAVTIDAARGRPQDEVLAWMTLAAAGPVDTWRALAPRAVQIVAPHVLVDVLLGRDELSEACAARAEEAPSEEEWGAWLVLGKLRRRELRGFVKAQPALRRRLKDARRQAGRINPQLRDQLCALGLIASEGPSPLGA
jgi:hypothetical protein